MLLQVCFGYANIWMLLFVCEGGQSKKRTDSIRNTGTQIIGGDGQQILAISNGVPISVASSVYSKPSFVGSAGSANQTSNKFSKMSMANNMSARSGLIKSVD